MGADAWQLRENLAEAGNRHGWRVSRSPAALVFTKGSPRRNITVRFRPDGRIRDAWADGSAVTGNITSEVIDRLGR